MLGVLVVSVHARDERTGNENIFARVRSARSSKAFAAALLELAQAAELELVRVVEPTGRKSRADK